MKALKIRRPIQPLNAAAILWAAAAVTLAFMLVLWMPISSTRTEHYAVPGGYNPLFGVYVGCLKYNVTIDQTAAFDLNGVHRVWGAVLSTQNQEENITLATTLTVNTVHNETWLNFTVYLPINTYYLCWVAYVNMTLQVTLVTTLQGTLITGPR